ncbi:MAG: OmpA family protein [Planctomycetota bacterium]
MMRMISLAPALVGMALTFGGCANAETERLRETNRALNQRAIELEQDVEALEASVGSWQDRARSAESQAAEASMRARRLETDIRRLSSDQEDLLNRMSNLDVRVLPVELDAELEELAAQNPDLMRYDPERGVIELASDLTFDLGSAEVRTDARTRLDQLAQVLQGPIAQQFEVRVVGHTDNVPIRREATLRRHPTNMHLSVNRAIAVRDILVEEGLSELRVSVAGWGPHRPLVPNGQGGAPANRRVELELHPLSDAIAESVQQDNASTSPDAGASGNTTPATGNTNNTRPRVEEPMK